MSEFWQELIISWGGNAILGGLIIYLGMIYLERIGRNEQAAIDERLKSLEQNHEKLLTKDEHFHQISQEAYTNFFTAKMGAHIELANLKYDYILAIDEFLPDPLNESENINVTQVKLILEIRDHIRRNRIYWSDGFLTAFDEWNDTFTSEKSKIEYDIRERWSHFTSMEDATGEPAGLLADIEKHQCILEFLDDSSEYLNTLFIKIDSDINLLRKKYNL
ncbi:hypothetical protein [Psychrobacter urativorans]|uniref:hypothetical protein n=1 Tax=Psychrobacter urativorans TaxID=45610 RepID=UPI00191891CB|nr:hypothetical protein [Psychrobacter urativorans]